MRGVTKAGIRHFELENGQYELGGVRIYKSFEGCGTHRCMYCKF